jgi:thymidylate synthase
MLEALECGVARAERMREFVPEALASDAGIEAGAAVYRAEDVHVWLEHLAAVEKPARPRH